MIEIRPSLTADSRTCDVTTVSPDQLFASSEQHIDDVRKAHAFFVHCLSNLAQRHDYDKLTDLDGFYANFSHKFAEGHRDWLDRHVTLNRHHLNDPRGVPDDVNLLDVLDFIADCTMAGKGRSGSVRPLVIDAMVLARAFQNTCALLDAEVVVVEG